jgi:hypothetical protein
VTMNAVEQSLIKFRELVNAHPRMKTLLKGWDRTALVEVEDTGDVFTVEFRDCQIVDLQTGNRSATDSPIILKATQRILSDIFTGVLNPASEFLDGRLQVFASDRDQVKLDAISLVLWD